MGIRVFGEKRTADGDGCRHGECKNVPSIDTNNPSGRCLNERRVTSCYLEILSIEKRMPRYRTRWLANYCPACLTSYYAESSGEKEPLIYGLFITEPRKIAISIALYKSVVSRGGEEAPRSSEASRTSSSVKSGFTSPLADSSAFGARMNPRGPFMAAR